MNILLVDDEALVLRGLSTQLTKYKPHWTIVGQATDGQRAMEIINKCDVDVMVTDIRMPRMSGLDLTRYAIQRQTTMRVIILTGYAEFEYARRALRYGVRDYIVKPVEYTVLIKVLEEFERELTGHVEKPGVIDTAINYVEKHYASPDLSLTLVADIVNLSPPHFSRLFKKRTGDLFVNFLTRIRIGEACKLLQEGKDTKICEVGEAVGYPDQHYFSQIFRKVTGVTPKQYREQKFTQINQNL